MLGVRNRSGHPMDTNWTLSTYYPSASVFFTSSQAFHRAGKGDAYPKFPLTITSAQINKLRSSQYAGNDAITFLSRTFNVTGIHGTYRFTRYETATATNRGNAFLWPRSGGVLGRYLGLLAHDTSVLRVYARSRMNPSPANLGHYNALLRGETDIAPTGLSGARTE